MDEDKEVVWWNDAFSIISTIEGDEWAAKYWKKVGPSKNSAWKRGWSIVPIEIKEVMLMKGKGAKKKEAKKPKADKMVKV